MTSTTQKTVLWLGAGLSSPPAIAYLAEHGLNIIVASRTEARAKSLIAGLGPNASTAEFDIEAEGAAAKLEELTQKADLVVSLLPYIYHVQAAKVSLKYKKHFVTASYQSDEMTALDAEARANGTIIVNECGVDPGLDHMSAQRVIDEVHGKGGKIKAFYSICGGLPSPAANNNPFGYKLSWAPRGVLMASKNSAVWLKDGKRVAVSGLELFSETTKEETEVGDLGTLEWYPNRDSTKYAPIYGIEEAETLIRATFRYPGWCRSLYQMANHGFTSLDEDLTIAGKTYAAFTTSVFGGAEGADPKEVMMAKLGCDAEDPTVKKFEWLGMFDKENTVPAKVKTALDGVCSRMEKTMMYAEGEKDMIAMKTTFEVEYSNADRKTLTSTLIDYGLQPAGHSSMSRTVSLPVAAVVRRVLDGSITMTGLQRPVVPELYNPILDEMEQLGIKFVEQAEPTTFHLRHEVKVGEERVALVPRDVAALIAKGFLVNVEKSPTRCVPDAEYAKVGAKLVATGSWPSAPKSDIILGLKELPESKDPLNHRHILFAHCYKNQGGWKDVLGRFAAGKGLLWDLEFLNDESGRRVAAFGRPAGVVGMALGLLQWAHQQLGENIGALKSWKTTQDLVDTVKAKIDAAKAKNGKSPSALVIGALGRCGGGAVWFAEQVGVSPTQWDMAETKAGGPFKQLLDVDVLVNCIYLNQKIAPFLTKDMLATEGRKLSVFCDVSCDSTNPNNPFPVYGSAGTTLGAPLEHVLTGDNPFDVIAIDHLPALIPADSSEMYSKDLLPHLLLLDEPTKHGVWTRAETLFNEKCAQL